MLNDDHSKEYLELFKSVLCASLYDESAWRIVEGPLRVTLSPRRPMQYAAGKLTHAVVRLLGRRNISLVKRLPYQDSLRREGLDWPMFGYTMIGRQRLDNIQACVEQVLTDGVPGDFMETGVWRGGATMLMRAVLKANGVTERVVWCADSFEGLPPPNETDKAIDFKSDFSDRAFLKVSQEQVEANFSRFGLLDSQVRFIKGWFNASLPTAPVSQLALLRLDGDLYESTMDALTYMYPKLSLGGYVIIDDYNSWPGCNKAVNEYRESHRITSPLQSIDAHACYWRVQ